MAVPCYLGGMQAAEKGMRQPGRLTGRNPRLRQRRQLGFRRSIALLDLKALLVWACRKLSSDADGVVGARREE